MNRTSPKMTWKRMLLLSQLCTVPLLGACNGAVSTETYAIPDAKVLAEDSMYMNKLFERAAEVNGVQQVRIDFADDRQYQIVMNRVVASGNTPQNSPMLFEKLADMRAKALADKAAGVQAQGITTQANEDFCGHWISVKETDGTTNTTFDAKVIISCTNGSDYLYGDLTAYDSNLAETSFTNVGSDVEEQYGNGKLFENVAVTVSVPKTTTDRLMLFDSQVIAIDSATGRETSSFVRVKTSTIGTPPTLTVTHPQNRIGTSVLRTCLERGSTTGNLDCDYSTVYKDAATNTYKMYKAGTTPVGVAGVTAGATTWTADPSLVWLAPSTAPYNTSKLYSALRGSFNAGSVGTTACTITSYDTNLTNASIILTERGGRCTAGKSVGTVAGQMDLSGSLSPGVGTRSFNTLANFGTDCLGYEQNVKMLVNIASFATCDSSGYAYARYRTVEVNFMDFKNSCFAEGTQVTLANGKRVNIETVKVGDKLINEQGQVLTVTTLEQGGESQPMVRLKDDKGHEVLVTSKHPVVLADGKVVTAETLKVSDKVKTDKGVAMLTAVGREAYSKDVFNVVLGTEAELAQAGKNRTLFANGFLMGDSSMQMELQRQQDGEPKDVLARLSPRWHNDYRNDLARKATR